jgi:hypothetical protein
MILTYILYNPTLKSILVAKKTGMKDNKRIYTFCIVQSFYNENVLAL